MANRPTWPELIEKYYLCLPKIKQKNNSIKFLFKNKSAIQESILKL